MAPATGALLNDSAAVLDRLDAPDAGEVEGEVLACQVELISGVCETVADAMGQLGELERAVLDAGVGLLRSGTHPSAQEGEAQVSNKERYQLISSLLGDAVATPVSALHVHVGVPDPETAIRVFNGLRRHLPLLEALGANSPFRHGRDTGLASAREITRRPSRVGAVGSPARVRQLRRLREVHRGTDRGAGWSAPPPAAGHRGAARPDVQARPSTPPPCRRAVAGPPRSAVHRGARPVARALTAVAEVPDYTFHWWKLRPHPRLGTVELRALDVQARPEHTAALVAAVQSLARHEAQAEPVAGPAPEILDEASFKAARARGSGRRPCCPAQPGGCGRWPTCSTRRWSSRARWRGRWDARKSSRA